MLPLALQNSHAISFVQLSLPLSFQWKLIKFLATNNFKTKHHSNITYTHRHKQYEKSTRATEKNTKNILAIVKTETTWLLYLIFCCIGLVITDSLEL